MKPTEFARYLGVSPGYISNLKRDGRLVLSCDGEIMVAESLKRIEATRRGKKRKVADCRPQSLIEKLSALDPRVLKVVRIHYQAIRLQRLLAIKLQEIADRRDS